MRHQVLYGPVTFLRWYDPDQVQGLKAFATISQPKHLWAPLATNANMKFPLTILYIAADCKNHMNEIRNSRQVVRVINLE